MSLSFTVRENRSDVSTTYYSPTSKRLLHRLAEKLQEYAQLQFAVILQANSEKITLLPEDTHSLKSVEITCRSLPGTWRQALGISHSVNGTLGKSMSAESIDSILNSSCRTDDFERRAAYEK